MNAPADPPRIRAVLGQPALGRLVDALEQRLALGRALTGRLTLIAATPTERAALDSLLGRKPTRGGSLQVDLDFLAETLRDAGISHSLREAVEALRGTVRNRRAEAESLAAAWAEVRTQARAQFAPWPALVPWVEELFATGQLKRLAAEPAPAAAVLADLETVVRALPRHAEPLATFAARLFGDAHALDPGAARATLAVRAAARLGELAFEDDAEGRRSAWASVGILGDELSAPVLTFNLPAAGDTPLARLLRTASRDAEPLHLSLRLLLRHPLTSDPALAGTAIFVCENPSFLAQAARALGRACASLVCVNGQFATPTLILLRQLHGAGARLRYHGDFDPGGLAIARRVFAECGATPWRYAAEDYELAPKGKKFSGMTGPTPWSPALAERMQRECRAVHEEAIAETLLPDLVRPEPAPDG